MSDMLASCCRDRAGLAVTSMLACLAGSEDIAVSFLGETANVNGRADMIDKSDRSDASNKADKVNTAAGALTFEAASVRARIATRSSISFFRRFVTRALCGRGRGRRDVRIGHGRHDRHVGRGRRDQSDNKPGPLIRLAPKSAGGQAAAGPRRATRHRMPPRMLSRSPIRSLLRIGNQRDLRRHVVSRQLVGWPTAAASARL